MQYSAQYFIDKLNLAEHPEGGYYISSFRSAEEMAVRDVKRPIYTSIYFFTTFTGYIPFTSIKIR